MNQPRGFALVAVLWVVVALGGVALTAASKTELSSRASADRILGIRATWAAEACLAVALASLDTRAAAHRSLTDVRSDTIPLSNGTACHVTVTDSTLYPPSLAHQRPVPRLFVEAHGWVANHAGSRSARIDVLAIAAGARIAPVRRRVW